ncbi:HD domain-containing protein [Leptospira ognonensis]|uniref:HD domain-containing protein n=1 Tax=Leptospira ognonensis TaxID=2484945 RepID=A0A4R9JT04_9LEPT|nr:HD domain-containing phosphohydrolase [Leptospira ognonensis]TGL55858.1 HD domain-containing protein [Leptospira ognonensis]
MSSEVNSNVRNRFSWKSSSLSLQEMNWALTAFAKVAQTKATSQSIPFLLESICETLTLESPYLLAWVGLAENTPEKYVSVLAAAGPAKGYLSGLEVSWSEDSPLGQGPTGKSIRSGQPHVLSDSQGDKSFSSWTEKASAYGIRSSLSIPINGYPDGRLALMIYSSEPLAFENQILQIFQAMADEVAHGIKKLDLNVQLAAEKTQNLNAQRQLNEILYQTIKALSLTLESRDPYTAGHEDRVSKIACAIAKEMGWSEFRVQGLQLAAMVHDIGKIAIPSEILTKPSRLSATEMALIREHSETGFRILKDISFPWPIARMVREHHEKLDGSGYPRGISGSEILLESRILVVADIVESISSFRPYRPALGFEVALEEIKRLAGIQLDADVVEICIQLYSEHPEQFHS